MKQNYRETVEQKREYDYKRTRQEKRRQDRKANHQRWAVRYPEKYRAHYLVRAAIRDGRLFKKPCENCGSTERVQAHHEDYWKPLDVRWLCFRCHRGLAHNALVDFEMSREGAHA